MNHLMFQSLYPGQNFLNCAPQCEPRCECHECTRIRWKMSLQGQMESASSQSQQIPQQVSPDQPDAAGTNPAKESKS
jgi:hypothetical protein